MRLTPILSTLAVLGLSANAHAHERWVEHALKSEFDRGLFDSLGFVNVGTLLGVLVLAVVLLLWSGRLRAPASGPESSLVAKLKPWAPFLLRVTFGLGMILVALQNQFLAPDLLAREGWEGFLLIKAQGVIGVLLVLGLLTRFASLTSILLFVWATATRPFQAFDGNPVTMIQVLNYIEVVGIGIYLAIAGGGTLSLDGRFLPKKDYEATSHSRAQGVGLMRILLGITLILLGIQKFMIPELPMGVLQNYADAIYVPIYNITGISPEGYVFAASVVEATVGVLVLAGLFIRPVMIILTGLFLTTLVIFQEDLIPHLPLFGMVFVFLIEGAGSLRLDTFTMPKDTMPKGLDSRHQDRATEGRIVETTA
jgi:uncharacterized membrane protein YphA (DoxX/SURF4 family)